MAEVYKTNITITLLLQLSHTVGEAASPSIALYILSTTEWQSMRQDALYVLQPFFSLSFTFCIQNVKKVRFYFKKNIKKVRQCEKNEGLRKPVVLFKKNVLMEQFRLYLSPLDPNPHDPRSETSANSSTSSTSGDIIGNINN
jgi:hypothetical protein